MPYFFLRNEEVSKLYSRCPFQSDCVTNLVEIFHLFLLILRKYMEEGVFDIKRSDWAKQGTQKLHYCAGTPLLFHQDQLKFRSLVPFSLSLFDERVMLTSIGDYLQRQKPREVLFCNPSDSLESVLKSLVQNDAHCVYIQDHNNAVIQTFSITDFFHSILRSSDVYNEEDINSEFHPTTLIRKHQNKFIENAWCLLQFDIQHWKSSPDQEKSCENGSKTLTFLKKFKSCFSQ